MATVTGSTDGLVGDEGGGSARGADDGQGSPCRISIGNVRIAERGVPIEKSKLESWINHLIRVLDQSSSIQPG